MTPASPTPPPRPPEGAIESCIELLSYNDNDLVRAARAELRQLRQRASDLELIAKDLRKSSGRQLLVVEGGDWMCKGRILESERGLPLLDDAARAALRRPA